MADQQQQKQITNLESCRRLQALANYRESENDLFEAISVLNQALFYLNPKAFSTSCQRSCEAAQLKTDIRIKQVQLYLGLKKPTKALPTMFQLIKNSEDNIRVEQLIQKLMTHGIKEEEIRVQTRCQ